MIEERNIGVALISYGVGILTTLLFATGHETKVIKSIDEKWQKEAIMMDHAYYDNIDRYPVFTWKDK